MRDSQRHLTAASLTLPQLRSIGDWGGASRLIGRRWEEVGLVALRQGTGQTPPFGIIAICDNPPLQHHLGTLGLPNPDALVVEADGDSYVVRPVDLKWALDVASYRQISGTNLAALFEADPSLVDLVSETVGAIGTVASLHPVDGYFVCPDSTANRRFLTGPQNQHQEYPIESGDVMFVQLDVRSFFEPLPGWYTAKQLARLDGSQAGLRQIDVADRYYHLGAGVNGALIQRTNSIFNNGETEDDGDEAARWATISAEVRPLTTSAILSRLQIEMRRRRDLVQRLRALRRCPYTFGEFVDDLRANGLVAPEDEPDATWGPRYGEVARTHATALMAAGRSLVAAGQSDAQALAHLEARQGEFASRARARARAIIASVQESGDEFNTP